MKTYHPVRYRENGMNGSTSSGTAKHHEFHPSRREPLQMTSETSTSPAATETTVLRPGDLVLLGPDLLGRPPFARLVAVELTHGSPSTFWLRPINADSSTKPEALRPDQVAGVYTNALCGGTVAFDGPPVTEAPVRDEALKRRMSDLFAKAFAEADRMLADPDAHQRFLSPLYVTLPAGTPTPPSREMVAYTWLQTQTARLFWPPALELGTYLAREPYASSGNPLWAAVLAHASQVTP